jgi:hypothetical protein
MKLHKTSLALATIIAGLLGASALNSASAQGLPDPGGGGIQFWMIPEGDPAVNLRARQPRQTLPRASSSRRGNTGHSFGAHIHRMPAIRGGMRGRR